MHIKSTQALQIDLKIQSNVTYSISKKGDNGVPQTTVSLLKANVNVAKKEQ